MRLVQAAMIPKVKYWVPDSGLLGNIELEYMGSAEFEFGNVPKALYNFLRSSDEKVFGTIQLRAGKLADPQHTKEGARLNWMLSNASSVPMLKDEIVSIGYLVRKSKERDLRIALEQWAFAGNPMLKERAYPATKNSMHFCIDEGSEFFLWHSKRGKRVIRQHIVKSWELLCGNERFNQFGQVFEEKPADELLRIVPSAFGADDEYTDSANVPVDGKIE